MKHSPKKDTGSGASSDTAEPPDWLDEVALRRLTTAEIAVRRRELAGRPAESRRLEQELALNHVLDARPGAPKASTNFAALVRARIEAEERAEAHPLSFARSDWRRWLHWLRPAMGVTAVTAAVTMGWRVQSLNRQHRLQLAHSVATVALSTGSPELTAESLENFDVIRRLGATPQPGDEALIAALAEAPVP